MNKNRNTLKTTICLLILATILLSGCFKKEETDIVSFTITADKQTAWADGKDVIIFKAVGTYKDGTVKEVDPDYYYMMHKSGDKLTRQYSKGILKPYTIDQFGEYDIFAKIDNVRCSAVPVNYKEMPKPSKITISGDKTTIRADNIEFATFSAIVQDQYTNDITTKSAITYSYVKTGDTTDTAISGNLFRTTEKGSYKIYAKAQGAVSDGYILEAVKLETVTITTVPSKLTYVIGEKIDLSGLVITGNYSDNTKKVETITAENITGFESVTSGTKTIIVTVEGKSATFGITVSKVEITVITIKKSATKLSYNIGESLDITGLEITGAYSNGSTKTETITTNNITGFDSTTVGKKTLTINVGDKTITYQITIVNNVKPVIKLTGKETITVENGMTYTDEGAKATDSIDGDITKNIVTSGAVNTAVDGTYTLKYNVSNSSKNTADEVMRTVIVKDTIKPVINSVKINNGSEVTTNASVILTIDAESGTKLFYNKDNSQWIAAITQQSIMLTTEGVNTINIKCVDNAGNETVTSSSIKLDTIRPTGTIVINDGAVFTNNLNVVLTLSAEGADYIKTSNDNKTFGEWKASAGNVNWILTDGDGLKTVYIIFKDKAGNESQSYNASITLKRSTTGGALIINVGKDYTTNTTVKLSISSGDAKYMSFSDDGKSWSDWETFAVSKDWTLKDSDGIKTVYLKTKDSVDNVSEFVMDSIILDRIPPATPTFSGITSGIYNVNQNISIGGIELNAFAEYSLDNGSSWKTYNGTAVLIETEGSYKITARQTDKAGNISQISPKIDLTIDKTKPVINSVKINNGSEYTTTTSVTVKTDAESGTKLSYSKDNINWEEGTTQKTITLIEGTNTVYVKCVDSALNTTVTSSTIILDTIVPTGTISINNGAKYTKNKTVNLTLVSNAPAEMKFSTDGNAWTDWETFKTTRSYTMPDGDAVKTIYARYRDKAGNEYTTNSSIILDTVIPVITLNGDLEIVMTAGLQYKDEGATALDNIDGSLTEKIVVVGVPDVTSPIGIYIMSYNVKDNAGNVAQEVTRKVTLKKKLTFTGRNIVPAASPINAVAYSPDGTKIATGSNDGIIKIWDAISGSYLKGLMGHTSYIRTVVFNSDGTKLISGSDDKTIKMWNVSSGECLKTLSGHVCQE